MSTHGDELGAVLEAISGTDLYRNNAFRVTGLPPDASPARVRRAREEALLKLRMSGAAPRARTRTRTSARAGADDGTQRAFETIRDPVARLTHELLWPWPAADPPVLAAQERAVAAHRAAVEGEQSGPFEPGSAEAAALDPLWDESLAAWATVLADRAFWEHARRRVTEIDDPRLTSGTVRRLRARLPVQLASATAELARRAVRDGPGEAAATRLVALLRRSPLPAEAVDEALREAVRPDERAVREACAAARAACEADLTDGAAAAEAGRALTRQAEAPLRAVATLLGERAALTDALSEETAVALNQCGVIHSNQDGDPLTALELLGHAEELARDRRTVELVARNTKGIEDAAGWSVPTGPADDLPPELRLLCEHGKVERAAGTLRAVAARVDDAELARTLRGVAADRRSLAAPVRKQPPLGAFLGCGLRLVRHGEPNPKGVFYATYALTLLYLPLLPLAAYRADEARAYVKVPLTGLARWWRRIFLTACWGPAAPAVFVVLVIALTSRRGDRVRAFALARGPR